MALLCTPRLFPTSISHSTTPFSTVIVKPRDPPPSTYIARRPQPQRKTSLSLDSPQRSPRSSTSSTRSTPRSTPRSTARSSPPRSPQRAENTEMGGSNGFHPFNGRVSRHFDSTQKQNSPYLSYHDVLLTKEDIDVLKDDWLTDNVIAFWQEHLEREYLTQYPRAKIVLLRPSMTFLLMQTQDPNTLREALPSLKQTTHIFFPINDCRNPAMAEGGSHWSLLLVSIVDGAAFHYDSLNSANRAEAAVVTRKMSQLLGKNLTFMDLNDAPQQENGSDCGVFVCINMKHLLLKRLLRVQQGEKVSMSMGGREIDAAKARKDIFHIIEGYRKEGERRRSSSMSPMPGGRKSTSPPRIE